jgi:hypothetical protein
MATLWKKRLKNQSPADPIEHPLSTLFINSRQNSLTTKTSVRMRLLNKFHQVFGNLLKDWSTLTPETGNRVRLFHLYNEHTVVSDTKHMTTILQIT